MNDTAIVSCFYTNLHGTKYGGRQDRHHHYLYSLSSLLKITNADFIIYCDPLQEQELKEHIEQVAKTKVSIFPYSLDDFYMKDLFSKYKNIEEAISSQRCQEIQYLKTYWMNRIKDYNYVFWIDAGISYSGLIPDKHLIFPDNGINEYFNSNLFCNELIDGMKKVTQEKLIFFGIHNSHPVPYRRLIFDHFKTEWNNNHHIIAGILGGKLNLVYNFHQLFYELATETIEKLNVVYDEESIYNVLWDKYPDMFNVQKFDMWWHENNIHSIYDGWPEKIEEVKNLKSFYHTLENLITIGKQND